MAAAEADGADGDHHRHDEGLELDRPDQVAGVGQAQAGTAPLPAVEDEPVLPGAAGVSPGQPEDDDRADQGQDGGQPPGEPHRARRDPPGRRPLSRRRPTLTIHRQRTATCTEARMRVSLEVVSWMLVQNGPGWTLIPSWYSATWLIST